MYLSFWGLPGDARWWEPECDVTWSQNSGISLSLRAQQFHSIVTCLDCRLAWDHSLDCLFHYLPQALRVLESSASNGPYTDLNLLPHLIVNTPQTKAQPHHQPGNVNVLYSMDMPSWLSTDDFSVSGNARLNSMYVGVVEELKRVSNSTFLQLNRQHHKVPPPGYLKSGSVSRRAVCDRSDRQNWVSLRSHKVIEWLIRWQICIAISRLFWNVSNS